MRYKLGVSMVWILDIGVRGVAVRARLGCDKLQDLFHVRPLSFANGFVWRYASDLAFFLNEHSSVCCSPLLYTVTVGSSTNPT